MKSFSVISAVIVLVTGLSCCKIRCADPTLYTALSGFDTTEVETVIVRKYKNDGKFSDLVSRRVFIRVFKDSLATPGKLWQYVDTVYFPSPWPPAEYVDRNFDYTVELPYLLRTFKINGISFGKEKTNVGYAEGCTKSASWYVDGQQQTYGGYWYAGGSATIVIKK